MNIYRSVLLLLLGLIVFTGCSRSVDTALLSSDEHLKYAQELFNEEDYEKCLAEFQNIILQYPGSAVNDDAQYFLAFTYYKREEFLLAAYEFSKLIRDIPASQFVPDAQYMLAESYYNLSPDYQLDQTYTKKSIDEFQAFIDFFPVHPKVEDAEKKIHGMNLKLAKKEYNNAVIYEKMDYTKAALKYYTLVVNTYHDTEYAPKALYKKINLLIEKERKDEALKSIRSFLSRYPDAQDAMEVARLEAEFAKD